MGHVGILVLVGRRRWVCQCIVQSMMVDFNYAKNLQKVAHLFLGLPELRVIEASGVQDQTTQSCVGEVNAPDSGVAGFSQVPQ